MAPYRYFFHVTRYCNGGEEKKKRPKEDVEVISMEFTSVSAVHQQHKNSVVRVVLAGGMVELYAGAVSAKLVMERYPGLCLTRPDVFKKPHESLVSPMERLLPGQKFYLVPRSTVKKLRQNIPHSSGEDLKGDVIGRKVEEVKEEIFLSEVEEREGDGCGELDESICSAKDFYVSKEKWSHCFQQRIEEQHKPKKPFTPPFKRVRSRTGLLGGWKPSLNSVKELSP